MSNGALAGLAGVIVFAALCLRLGHLPLLAPDEGRNAEVAREMKEAGAWLVPTYNGLVYLDKPAFYFKAVALSLAVGGDNETAARLPSAVFGVALAALVFAFCRKVYSIRCGLLAAMVVATTPLFAGNARTVIFDMTLAFFVCAAIFAGYLAETQEGSARRKWYLLGAAAAGFGTLVKGPVGALIPFLVLLVFNGLERHRGAWKRLLAPLNLLVFFAITLPWFIGLCLTHPDFVHYGLVEETFHRFTSAKTFHRSEPVYFYVLIVAGAFFPWSLLLPEASVGTWKQRWARHSADRLCLVWCLVVIVFFSCSASKLPGYILSVAVASGILVARLFDAALERPEGRAAAVARRGTLVFALLCLVLAMGVGAGAPQAHLLAKPLRIPEDDARRLAASALPLAVLLALFFLFSTAAVLRRSALVSFLCLVLFVPCVTHVGMGVFEVIFGVKSGRAVAQALPSLPAETELACFGCFPNGVPFYRGQTMTLITGEGDQLTSNYIIYTIKRSTHPRQIVLLPEFDAWLASRKTAVFLITEPDNRARLEQIASARGATVQSVTARYVGALIPPPEKR